MDKQTILEKIGAFPIIVFLLFAMLLLLPVDLFVHDRDRLFQVADSVILADTIGIFATSLVIVVRALLKPFSRSESGDAYLAAIVISFLGFALIILGLWIWRFMDRPNGMELSFFWLTGRWIAMIGLTAYLAIIWTGKGAIEIRGARKAIMVVTAAIGVGIVVIMFAVHGVTVKP